MKKRENFEKTFIKIWIGQSISLITSSIVQYAIIWYITYKTESALWLSLSTLVGFLPQGILGLFIGSYIDKQDRKRIMINSDIFIAIVSLILVFWGLYSELPIWLILVCLGLRSVGASFHAPSLQASIPLIVPEDQLLKYSGYAQSLQSISLIVSPVIAAVIYGKINISLIILIDVVGVIIALVTLIISEIPNLKMEVNEEIDFIEETKAGYRIIINNKIVKYLFIISGIYILLYMPINSLFPLMTVVYFAKPPFYVGLVEILFATGMLLGGIALAKLKIFNDKKKNLISSILIMGISIFISGLLMKEMFLIFLILSFFMGISGPITQATITTIFAEQIPVDYLGRVYSNYMSLTVVVMPLGLLLSGSFADVIGINIWFVITGVCTIILSVFLKFNKISFEK